MFGVSFPELIVIAVLILVVFGPEKLPEMMRTFGRLTGQLRRQSDSLRREFYNSVYRPADEFKGTLERETRNLIAEPTQKPAQPEQRKEVPPPPEPPEQPK